MIEDPDRFEGNLLEVVKDGVAYRGAVDAFPQRSYRDSVADALDHDHS